MPISIFFFIFFYLNQTMIQINRDQIFSNEERFKKYLNLENSEDDYKFYLSSAEMILENRIGKCLGKKEIIINYIGNSFIFPYEPRMEILECEINKIKISLLMDNENLNFCIDNYIFEKNSNIYIKYLAGFEKLPSNLEYAVFYIASQLLHNKDLSNMDNIFKNLNFLLGDN